MNIDYELQAADLELRNVTISIPLPTGSGAPNVASVDGEYAFDRSVECARPGVLDSVCMAPNTSKL